LTLLNDKRKEGTAPNQTMFQSEFLSLDLEKSHRTPRHQKSNHTKISGSKSQPHWNFQNSSGQRTPGRNNSHKPMTPRAMKRQGSGGKQQQQCLGAALRSTKPKQKM